MTARRPALGRQLQHAIVAHQVQAAVGRADPDVLILAEDRGDVVAAEALLGRVVGELAARQAIQAAVGRPDPERAVAAFAQHR